MTIRRTLLLFTFLTTPLFAASTSVTVHVVAHDAKILGTHVGGARVTIRDAATGSVLAKGTQVGETGDTDAIMKQPHARGAALYTTEKAASFTGSFDIDRPTKIEIVAEGPVDFPQALQWASTTMVVLPGQTIGGDGVVLELHGLVIDLLQPKEAAAPGTLAVKMKVMMMCGCPIEPGGLWDAAKLDVQVKLRSDKGVVVSAPARYDGTPSTFAATLPDVRRGHYTLEVTASDAAGNVGTFTQAVDVGMAAKR